MSDSYFNTTSLEGHDLDDAEIAARSQEERIQHFFRTAGSFLYTPSEVRREVFAGAVPITSVRRAMTNLEHAGWLGKSSKQRPGPYGRPEHCWFKRSAGTPAQQELAL
jgi:hypothetical protein